MSRFSVGIWQYDQNDHAKCFEDVARAVAKSLRDLGHEVVPIVLPDGKVNPNVGRLVMFGTNNAKDPGNKMPADAILFNSEQVASIEKPLDFIGGHEHFRDRVVWDYSATNIMKMKELGFNRLVHCPIGYHPSMSTIVDQTDQDIDVLFYGSVGLRRREILDDLKKANINVVALFGAYGKERDDVIARSKIVLNLHYFGKPIFEIFRVSHLLANRKCVVGENGGIDGQLEEFADRAISHVRRRVIVDTCRALLSDDALRHRMEEKGFEEFSKLSIVDNICKALEQS